MAKKKPDIVLEVDIFLGSDPLTGEFEEAIEEAVRNESNGTAKAKVKLKKVI